MATINSGQMKFGTPGAVIDSTNAYVGSGAWRWIRLSSGSELDDSLSGYVFGAQYQGFTN